MGRFLSPEQLADPNLAGPSADPDGDGVVNRVECAYFSDPTVGTSVPQGVLALFRANRMVRVDSRRQLVYRLERSGELAGSSGWTVLEEFLGDDRFHDFPVEPSTSGTVFYRLAVSPAPAAAFSTFTSASSTSTANR